MIVIAFVGNVIVLSLPAFATGAALGKLVSEVEPCTVRIISSEEDSPLLSVTVNRKE